MSIIRRKAVSVDYSGKWVYTIKSLDGAVINHTLIVNEDDFIISKVLFDVLCKKR